MLFQAIKAVNTFQGVSNLPKDRYVNTFHINRIYADGGAYSTLADYTAIASHIKSFYGDPGLNGSILGLMDTPGLALSGHSVKIYDMSVIAPRPPVYTLDYSIIAEGGSVSPALPSEVAFCLSYRAAVQAGVPQGRRRGRIFLGPLTVQCMQPPGRPSSALGTIVRSQAVILAGNIVSLVPSGGYGWVVHSKYNVTGAEQAAGDGIVAEVSTDDAFDIQRRRGLAPTVRVTVGL